MLSIVFLTKDQCCFGRKYMKFRRGMLLGLIHWILNKWRAVSTNFNRPMAKH